MRSAIRCCFLLLAAAAYSASHAAGAVDFQRDIRPILSDKCFACHGPDKEHREADLRLDIADAAVESAIVPGQPDQSQVIERILSADPDVVMPPPHTGKTLTADEVELLRQWIQDGAAYETHWAFVAPTRPELPPTANKTWARNSIDAFVLSRLAQEQLQPAPETDRITWLRRLSLDLIGLPPSIEDVDAFVADASTDAFARQIDRLLSSPHFGERWGRIWLDAARYADSDGYEKDKPRSMWFYRDWVVNAMNADKPYNEFIIEQMAGDLLPEATQAQLVATGFLRNSMVNEEGGADPEQFRMEGMFDRMDAVGKAVLGLTTQCAQCHSHKYDPLTHDAYYQMFAFLNNSHDAIIPAYTAAEQQQRESLRQQIAGIERELKNSTPTWRQDMAAWASRSAAEVHQWEVLKPVDLPFEGQKFRVLEDSSIISESYAPASSSPRFTTAATDANNVTALRLELLTHPQLPRRGPGRSIRGTAAITEMAIFAAPASDPSKRVAVKIASATADVNPIEASQPEYLINIRTKGGDKRTTGPIEFAIDGSNQTAWTTDVDAGRRNQNRNAVFVFETPVNFEGGTVFFVQPKMNHGGWNSDDNHNCIMGRYRFSVTSDAHPRADPLPQHVRNVIQRPVEQWTAEEEKAVFTHYRETVAAWDAANEQIDTLWRQHPEGASQLVLEERSEPRTTALLNRGDFLSPLHEVKPGVPEFLHPLPPNAEASRLTFARWIVDRQSPTTARAIVNRIWQAYFGIGLVETSDDLGSQSTPPSHPQLLDWLAVELMDNNWSLKHIHRLITSSATYRQSSHVTPELQHRDPYNRLLARGPRFRVHAEIVRDIALSASGLLSPKLGGPAVYPPAPAFLFQPPASYGPKTWDEAQDARRYRRALYTFRFRSVPFPMLETFDAAQGTVSCVRRSRSNTPLQALTILNEPLSVECAQALAAETLTSGGSTDQDKLTFAMRRCVSRPPVDDELQTLQQLLDKQRTRIAKGELDAVQISGADDDSDPQLNERAAWTLVARALLSLDETITKE